MKMRLWEKISHDWYPVDPLFYCPSAACLLHLGQGRLRFLIVNLVNIFCSSQLLAGSHAVVGACYACVRCVVRWSSVHMRRLLTKPAGTLPPCTILCEAFSSEGDRLLSPLLTSSGERTQPSASCERITSCAVARLSRLSASNSWAFPLTTSSSRSDATE